MPRFPRLLHNSLPVSYSIALQALIYPINLTAIYLKLGSINQTVQQCLLNIGIISLPILHQN